MKKFIVVGLIGLMVMAFSATVYAQPKLEFRASGAMEATSFLYRNVSSGATGDAIVTRWGGSAPPGVPAGVPGTGFRPPGNPALTLAQDRADSGAWDRTNSYMEYRGVLRFDAIMGKELSGTFVFELDSSRWGERGGTRGALGNWNADTVGIEVKNMYIDVGLPYFGIPVPMTVRIGTQPIGMRPQIFNIVDGMGITGGLKIDPVTIGLVWAKALEGKDATADDADVYGLSLQAKLGTITAGGYWFYYNMNTYPLSNFQTTYGVTGVNQNSADFHWLGLFADGKLGPVNLNFDFVYDTGKVERRQTSGVRDVKYRGWATQIKIDYPWEKFNFGVLGMYASGADLNKTDRTGLPGGSTFDGTAVRKVGSYVIPPGSEEWAAWGESMFTGCNFITATALPIGMWPSLGTYPNQVTRGAIGGTWIAKLYASVKATPWYKVTLQGLYIGDTTKHGNTLGDARKTTGLLRNDSTIGWEFDLINEIQIYKNLKWSIGAGVLFAGDALDQFGGSLASRAESPKDPWILATKLRYDF
jgi:hypothetical protein